MSARYIQEGETIKYTNPSSSDAIAYGDVVDLDTRIGIAAADIAASADGDLAVTKVWELPAIATTAFTVGMPVYWDGSAEKVTDVGDGLTPAGWVVEPKLQAGAVALVKIG